MNESTVPLHRTPPVLFFAGTDTDVGKTYVAALVAAALHRIGHDIGVYKPVASGCRRVGEELVADDALELWEAAGRPRSLIDVCPQRFQAPLAPPEAASAEGLVVDAHLLREGGRRWEASCDVLITEGAGGLMSPLADGVLNIDLARQFDPCRLLIVAADRLGAIHQTLATCEAALHRGVRPFGIILCRAQANSGESILSNGRHIVRYTDIPVLGHVDFGDRELDPMITRQLTESLFPSS